MEKPNDMIDSLVSDWKIERPDLDVHSMHIVGRIIQLGKVLEKRASNAIRDTNIHYTDFDVLATLRRSGKPYELTPKVLMESVLLTSGAMTALLKRLENLNLIYRSTIEGDGRVKLVGLSESGIKTIDHAVKLRFDEAHDAVKGIDINENEILIGLLKKLMSQLN
jgi:DNA-binding MarR family transcriptional regulator